MKVVVSLAHALPVALREVEALRIVQLQLKTLMHILLLQRGDDHDHGWSSQGACRHWYLREGGQHDMLHAKNVFVLRTAAPACRPTRAF
jgi:hypothetical protein